MPIRVVAVITFALLVPAAPADPPAILERTTETITGRDGSDVVIESGWVEVPENRSDPDSGTIELAFIRAIYHGDEPGPPLFPIAGGPGGSSIEMVRGMVENGGQRFLDLAGGDVVGIDQRGVGLSRPNLQTPTLYGLDPTEPGDPETMLDLMRRVCRDEAARWAERGVDLRGYNTVESADDIDAVRRALGYESIKLWGGSYGSHLAMAMIRRHGSHIDRALLTGPEGPNHTLKLPSAAQDALVRLGALVRKDATLRRSIPNLVAMLAGVLDRLDEGPAYADVDGQRVGVSKFDVQRTIANDIGTIRGGGDAVPALIKQLADGNFATIARRLFEERRDSGVWSAMFMAMDSASGMTAERAEQIETESPQTLLGDAVNFPFPGIAEAWGVPDLGDGFRGPLETDIPILFIVGDLDSRTPVANARALMEHMPNAHLIVVENVGHNDVPMGHPQLLRAWSGFLRGERVRVSRVQMPPIEFKPVDP